MARYTIEESPAPSLKNNARRNPDNPRKLSPKKSKKNSASIFRRNSVCNPSKSKPRVILIRKSSVVSERIMKKCLTKPRIPEGVSGEIWEGIPRRIPEGTP